MLQRTSVSLFIKDTANGSCGAGSWEHCFTKGLSDGSTLTICLPSNFKHIFKANSSLNCFVLKT